MFWTKKSNDEQLSTHTEGKSTPLSNSSCCHNARCPRCGYSVEGLALVCPRCREELPRGCSGNCSGCGN